MAYGLVWSVEGADLPREPRLVVFVLPVQHIPSVQLHRLLFMQSLDLQLSHHLLFVKESHVWLRWGEVEIDLDVAEQLYFSIELNPIAKKYIAPFELFGSNNLWSTATLVTKDGDMQRLF